MKHCETSKKFVVLTSVIFILTLLYCMYAFAYCVLNGTYCDWTLLVTLLTVSAAPFATSIATYMSKAKVENKFKIQSTFLKEKYELLYKMGLLNQNRANNDVENEIQKIDIDIESIDENVDSNIY